VKLPLPSFTSVDIAEYLSSPQAQATETPAFVAKGGQKVVTAFTLGRETGRCLVAGIPGEEGFFSFVWSP